MLNLAVLLEDSARKHPDRDAVVLGATRLTYAQVDGMANQVANLLVARGIRPGDKVALTCPNLPYFPVVYFGILKAGGVVVPLNVLFKGREIAYHLADSDAKAYFCFQGTPDLPMGTEGYAGFQDAEGCEHFFVITAELGAPSPIEGTETLVEGLGGQPQTFSSVLTSETDSAVILYTSGTTGQPKGAELSHANLVLNALESCRMLGVSRQGERHLVTLPLFHSFGSTVQMNAGFASGSTLVLLPRFDAHAAVALLQSEDITFFAGVPTMYWGSSVRSTETSTSTGSPATLPSRYPAGRASRWRSSRRSRGGSTSTSSRGTASPRPHRWPLSTRRTGRPSRARSGTRSGVSR